MIVLITGPSGAGKSTFVKQLMAEDERLAFSISTTTRPIRAGEKNGVDYDFVDEDRFSELVAEGAFVEWAHVHDNRYGTRRCRLDEMAAAGKIPLLDIDVQGGVNVIDLFDEGLVSVFLFPPSWAELERRLRTRATDSGQVIETRLKNARTEVGYADRYDYWLVNDDLDDAVRRMHAVILAESCRRVSFPGNPLG